MKKNITISLKTDLLKASRRLALDEDKSFSAWIAELIERETSSKLSFSKSRRRALKRLNEGLNTVIKPLSDEEIYRR
jgi:predicted transglutaminase-like cysteine proteinase